MLNWTRKNEIQYTHPHIRKKILSIIDGNALKDKWRIQRPGEKNSTHGILTQNQLYSVDLTMCSYQKYIRNFTNNTQIKLGYNTYHSLISMELDFVKLDRGPGVF